MCRCPKRRASVPARHGNVHLRLCRQIASHTGAWTLAWRALSLLRNPFELRSKIVVRKYSRAAHPSAVLRALQPTLLFRSRKFSVARAELSGPLPPACPGKMFPACPALSENDINLGAMARAARAAARRHAKCAGTASLCRGRKFRPRGDCCNTSALPDSGALPNHPGPSFRGERELSLCLAWEARQDNLAGFVRQNAAGWRFPRSVRKIGRAACRG